MCSLNNWGMPEHGFIWPVSQLIKLSGEDVKIIRDSETDEHVAGKFAVIGMLVLAIFVLSVYSSVHFLVNLLNGSHPIAIMIGLFWGAMIANIYYLLLFTITPPMLKGRDRAVRGVRREATTEKSSLARVSLIFRLLFVILLAVVIAQPWLVTIFDTSRWIEESRQSYELAFVRPAHSISSESAEARERRIADRREIRRLLKANNFYTRRIQLINSRFPMSWVVTFVVVLFFVVPIWLKYRIRSQSNFYEIKKVREERLVLDKYDGFKERYSAVFLNRFRIATEWYESCTDPPFNTCRKDEQEEFAEQKLLLDAIYGPEAIPEDHPGFGHKTMH